MPQDPQDKPLDEKTKSQIQELIRLIDLFDESAGKEIIKKQITDVFLYVDSLSPVLKVILLESGEDLSQEDFEETVTFDDFQKMIESIGDDELFEKIRYLKYQRDELLMLLDD